MSDDFVKPVGVDENGKVRYGLTSDLTATERAVAQLAEDYPPTWPGGLVVHRATAWWAINALLANPDLLVDLAIEAGGLEQVGWYDEAAKWVGEDLLPRMREETAAASRYEPVYRRIPTEANDGT